MFTPEPLGGRPPKTGAAGVAPALIFTPEPLGGKLLKTGAEGVAPTFGLTVPAGLELPAALRYSTVARRWWGAYVLHSGFV